MKKLASFLFTFLGLITFSFAATLTAGLSVHYSGGSSLSKDVEKWLKKTGAKQ